MKSHQNVNILMQDIPKFRIFLIVYKGLFRDIIIILFYFFWAKEKEIPLVHEVTKVKDIIFYGAKWDVTLCML